MEQMRSEFEKEMCNEYSWFADALSLADFHGDDATGYYTGGDFTYDGRSCADALFWLWRGWQASRQVVEIGLPERNNPKSDFYGELERGENMGIDNCAVAIRAAGLRIKGE